MKHGIWSPQEKLRTGFHAIVIENATLEAEPYDNEDFPFVNYKWKKLPLGFFGLALAEELTPSQLQIDHLLKVIDRSHVSMAVPRLWVKPTANFNPDLWTRQIGSVIVANDEPKIITQQILPPEVYNHLNFIYQKCYEITRNQSANGYCYQGTWCNIRHSHPVYCWYSVWQTFNRLYFIWAILCRLCQTSNFSNEAHICHFRPKLLQSLHSIKK